MTWLADAKGLDDRIRGLLAAGRFYAHTLQVNSADGGQASRHLIDEAKRINEGLKAFRGRYNTVLAPAAASALDRFLKAAESLSLASAGSNKTLEGIAGVRAFLTPLAAFRAELAYALADREAVVRRLSERAFQHLQRSIVADPEVRTRWFSAFKDSKRAETSCEKLGAVHLLLHGLWAFKVSATGEATDLVFPEHTVDTTEVEPAAEALVLTEWKIVRSPSVTARAAKQARIQAARYASSVLGGLELRSYRYLVLVSEDFLDDCPRDYPTADGFVYRHINLAVCPKNPSKKRARRSSTS